MPVMRRRSTAMVGAALVVMLAAPSGAHAVRRFDADDSPSPLDLRAVRVFPHGSTDQVFRLTTHAAFTDAQIDGEVGWFRLGFDTGSGSLRRSVYLVSTDVGVRGILANANGEYLRTLRASRAAPDAMRVRVPARVTRGLHYRFAVWSVWRGAPCSKAEPCTDWLPDEGTIVFGAVDTVEEGSRRPISVSRARSRRPASGRARTADRSGD